MPRSLTSKGKTKAGGRYGLHVFDGEEEEVDIVGDEEHNDNIAEASRKVHGKGLQMKKIWFLRASRKVALGLLVTLTKGHYQLHIPSSNVVSIFRIFLLRLTTISNL